jgi:diguanylate cyclase
MPNLSARATLLAAPGGPALRAGATPSRTISLPAVVGLAVGFGTALAAGVAWACAQAFGAGVPWVAPVSAALGVLAAALPLAALAVRVKVAGGLTREGLARDGTGAFVPGAADVAVAPGLQVAMAPGGIPRDLFMELAAREWTRARRYGMGAALLVVEIDRHSRLAQSRGEAAIESVLAAMLAQTAPTLRSADLLTRLSDSEMAVFLAHADPTGALDVAERIRERTEQLDVQQLLTGLPLAAQGATAPASAPAPLRLTVSVGVAQLRPTHANWQSLMDDAADALQAAHHAGGNCVRAAPAGAQALRSPGSWRDGRRTQPK